LETKKNQSHVYFQNLDVLRFIAAFMVVIAHGYEAIKGNFGLPKSLQGEFPNQSSTFWFYIENAIGNFGFGVDIFFLISGFLITYLLIKEKEVAGRISLKDFYIRRTLRIWPLYYFIIILGPLLVKWTGSTPEPNYLAQIFFVGNFNIIQTQQWVFPFAHYWSICVEEHFYLLWPFLVAFIPNKKLPAVFCTVIFTSILWRFYMSMNNHYNYYHFYLHTLSRLDVLAIGALLGYAHSQKPFEVNIPGYIRILIYLLIVLLFLTDHINSYNGVFNSTLKKYFYVTLTGLAIGSFLFGKNNVLAPEKRNIFHYFGKVSYGIYMYHNVLINIVLIKIMWPIHSINQGLFILIYVPLCLIIPVISYELMEKPFLKLKKRFEIIRTTR
jgi:peptidoglycan/LPS O-acetylase OafA/YrhL